MIQDGSGAWCELMKFDLNFGSAQSMITKEKIVEMISWEPRRFSLRDFEKPLKKPGELGLTQTDWNLIFPFRETFVPAFDEMCAMVDHIPFRSTRTAYFTFLKNVTPDDIDQVTGFLEAIKPYVAIRDCLALSFAIDYDREGGNPDAPQTRVGELRSIAKTYGKAASSQALEKANELAEECLTALKKLTCYNSATCIVAMPPSDPAKLFDLPKHLVANISERLGKPDKSDKVKTLKARPGNKELPCEEKLANIEGTVSVDDKSFKDEIVLLVDDLYQSGVSMNYVAMRLLEAGAKQVLGLSCEKTCSNDDNVSRR